VDTFDYKPDLQKLDGKPVPDSLKKAVEATKFANVFHGCKEELMGSPFSWKQYGQSGMWISELYPNLAGHVDDLCFIHSMQADSNNHAPASYQMHTGDVRPGKASLGSWTTYGLGTETKTSLATCCSLRRGRWVGPPIIPTVFSPPLSSRRVCATEARRCSTCSRLRRSPQASAPRSI